MLMRVIIRKLQHSAILSSQFIKSIPKRNSFSSVKSLKSDQHIALRTYVSSVPAINKSSELEQEDKENVHHKDGFCYWHYITTDPQFKELFFRKELISEDVYSSPLFTTLKEFSSKTEIVEEDLENLLTHLKTGLQNLSFYELLEAVSLTFKVYDQKDKYMWYSIQKCFDKEFLRRRSSFSISEILMIHNVLNAYKFYKRFDFAHKTIQKLSYKVDKLTHPQFVNYCYHCKKFSAIALDKFKYTFLNFINEKIPSLNQTELGLLLDVLTNTGLKLVPPLFQTVMVKVLREIENMDVIVIKSICKNLGTIYNVDNLQLVIDFQEKLIPFMSKFKNHEIQRLAYSGFFLRLLNKAFYNEVLKRVKSDIANFTLLDISRFVLLHAIFNVDDKEFLDMALNEFERRDDYLLNYVAYIKFLENLTHFQIYPKNLLEKVVSNEIFTMVMKNKSGLTSWASLKWSLELEKPEFILPELDQKLNVRLSRHMKFVILPTTLEVFHQRKLNEMLKDIYGENSVCSKRISFALPKCGILRVNKNLKIQEIPAEYMEDRCDLGRKPPCDDHIWVCILLSYRSWYTSYDEQVLNYKTETYLRQLSILGYKPIYIPSREWYPNIFKNPSGQTFLESFISSKLQQLTGEV